MSSKEQCCGILKLSQWFQRFKKKKKTYMENQIQPNLVSMFILSNAHSLKELNGSGVCVCVEGSGESPKEHFYTVH